MSYPHFLTLHDVEGTAPSDPVLQAYGGPLRVRRDAPTFFVNFVSSLDGVIAFGDAAGEGAGAVSLNSRADRFLMALLRCAADVVLIGASTMRNDLHHQWTPATLAPELRADLAAHRRRLTGASPSPPLAVVTASGNLPEGHPALVRPDAQVLILTTEAGRQRLPNLHESVRVTVLAERGHLDPAAILSALHGELDASAVLCEGGPQLFGQLLEADLVDELFLTLAPHVAGRTRAAPRPGFVEGIAYAPSDTPRLELRSLRQSGDHLFLRYGVRRRGPEEPSGSDAGRLV